MASLSSSLHLGWLSWWLSGKEFAWRCRYDLWVRKIPWRRKWQPTPVFLPGKFHGQKSLAGYSPWGIKRIWHNLATAAAAKSLQSCPTLCGPINGSPPGSPSLGFSRQEHWSGLPFPSPMHESEKWKWSPSVVSDSVRPHGLHPTRLLRPCDFPGKSTGVGCHCLHLGCL